MLIKTNIRKGSGRFMAHGVWWDPYVDEASMQLDCIHAGGKWENKTTGELAGEGLYYHFRRFQEIVWPERVWRKGPFVNYWAEQILECWLAAKYLGIMGCAASSKSDSLAAIGLTDWYAFPDCTTTLVSSTDLKMLELRVWGMVKKYHKSAKQAREWIPGHLIEGKLMIIQDQRSEFSEGRDFKNGIIGVPCFPTGTLVDTPCGPTPIENLQAGQLVFNACGIGRVLETHRRSTSTLVRLNLSDGRVIDCTKDHPIFTNRGWINAVDLETLDMVFSVHETMCLVRSKPQESLSKSEVLLPFLPYLSSSKEVCPLPKSFPAFEESARELCWTVLQSKVCQSVEREESQLHKPNNQTVYSLRQHHGFSSPQPKFLFHSMSQPAHNHAMPTVRYGVYVNPRISKEAEKSFLRSILQEESDWPDLLSEACESNAARNGRVEAVPEFDFTLPPENRTEANEWQQALVSDRHSVSCHQTSSGNRRWGSSNSRQNNKGCSPNQDIGIAWVESVEILEQGSDPRFNESEGGYTVHNIEVSGHPSYSVNGVVVHNCKKGNQWVGLGSFIGIHNKRVRVIADESNLMVRGFLDSTSNLSKCPDFKLVAPGNPNETTNAHGVICEPAAEIGGWEGGIDQTPGTKTWKTRFPDGLCLQLPGSDSPNLKASPSEEAPFPFLITRQQMEDDAHIWGRDDWHYAMFTDAKMPRGQGSRRVVTRQMCEKFGSVLEPFWRDSNRTKIAFLDAAYRGSGGDRCVFGELQFGLEAENDLGSEVLTGIISQKSNVPQGRQILALIDMVVIPINGDIGAESPEDQIVKFVQDQCTARGIAAENFFYDSGMRTSLVTAFSRMGFEHAESVDCGGKPTEDFVSAEINQRCCDYYQKKITELWYSVRYIIEARQFRGLNKDVMWELCAREWKHTVGTNKIEVESKEEMKVKTGRSPDLADALAVGCFGARQRGFQIARLMPKEDRDPRKRDWRDEIRDKARALWASGQLNHAA